MSSGINKIYTDDEYQRQLFQQELQRVRDEGKTAPSPVMSKFEQKFLDFCCGIPKPRMRLPGLTLEEREIAVKEANIRWSVSIGNIPELPAYTEMKNMFDVKEMDSFLSYSRYLSDGFPADEQNFKDLKASLLHRMRIFNGEYNESFKHTFPNPDQPPNRQKLTQFQQNYMRDNGENLKTDLNKIVQNSEFNKHRTPLGVRVLYKIAMFIASFLIVPLVAKLEATRSKTGSATLFFDLTDTAGKVNKEVLDVVDEHMPRPVLSAHGGFAGPTH